MAKADKKQRHKAKREEKRRAERRRQSVSPVKRLADARGELDCWMSGGWGNLGQKQLFVYKDAGRLTGLACFLVDRGVVGLKDAWSRVDFSRDEFKDVLSTCEREGILMRRTTLDQVRRWVASGVRWASENGMRLPKDWVKCAAVIGGVGDWAAADVSQFAREFAGHPEDLRRRLIGEPFETYIQRKDIDFTFSTNSPLMDLETGEYEKSGNGTWIADDEDEPVDEDDDGENAEDGNPVLTMEQMSKLVSRFSLPATALAADTAKWLNDRGEHGSEEGDLFEAWRSLMSARMVAHAAIPEEGEESAALAFEVLQDLAERIDVRRQAQYERAEKHVLDHLLTDPDMMKKAVLKHGLDSAADGQEVNG